MLIEIDESVLVQAQSGNQLAFDILNTLGETQKYETHIVWASRPVLEGILKLPSNKLGDNLKYFAGILKVITVRKSDIDKLGIRVVVTFEESKSKCMRDVRNKVIYLNPTDNIFKRKPFSSTNTTILSENKNDGRMFKHIVNWYLKYMNLYRIMSANINIEMGGGSSLSDMYEEYAKEKVDRFCLCIADSDIKADVPLLLREGLISKGNIPKVGDTYNNVHKYDTNNQPFNCSCYCFEKVLEIENLIPWNIIEKESNYKNVITKLHKSIDLSFFDFKKGIDKDNLDNSAEYIQLYWKNIIFDKTPNVLYQKIVLQGFGEKLQKFILDNHKEELDNINDSDLSPAQLYEYQEIGKRVLDWCCTMSIPKGVL